MAESNSLQNIAAIIYITPENSKISVKNDFLQLELTAPNEEGNIETKTYDRIFLHRAFPFDHPYSYISVLDKDSKEIGMISNVDIFDEDTSLKLRAELDRKYYAPVIKKINSVKERYGFSYWNVDTDAGPISFTLHDTYRSMLKVEHVRIFITDIDSNRYEIPNVEELDHKSYKKIELYL